VPPACPFSRSLAVNHGHRCPLSPDIRRSNILLARGMIHAPSSKLVTQFGTADYGFLAANNDIDSLGRCGWVKSAPSPWFNPLLLGLSVGGFRKSPEITQRGRGVEVDSFLTDDSIRAKLKLSRPGFDCATGRRNTQELPLVSAINDHSIT
jgi:hypothetical protein